MTQMIENSPETTNSPPSPPSAIGPPLVPHDSSNGPCLCRLCRRARWREKLRGLTYDVDRLIGAWIRDLGDPESWRLKIWGQRADFYQQVWTSLFRFPPKDIDFPLGSAVYAHCGWVWKTIGDASRIGYKFAGIPATCVGSAYFENGEALYDQAEEDDYVQEDKTPVMDDSWDLPIEIKKIMEAAELVVPEFQRTNLYQYYGIGGFSPSTVTEIATAEGISRWGAQLRIMRALTLIRRHLEIEHSEVKSL